MSDKFKRRAATLGHPLPLGGEAEKGKGPVDLFSAERAHMVIVRPGGNIRGEGQSIQAFHQLRLSLWERARGEGSQHRHNVMKKIFAVFTLTLATLLASTLASANPKIQNWTTANGARVYFAWCSTPAAPVTVNRAGSHN